MTSGTQPLGNGLITPQRGKESGVSSTLHTRMDSQSYMVNRPMSKEFFERFDIKIGKQFIGNKVAGSLNKTTFDWYYKCHTSDSLRTLLKNCFFKNPSSASSFSITECRKIKTLLRNRIANARARPKPNLKALKESSTQVLSLYNA